MQRAAVGEVEPAQAFLHFQPGQFRMPKGASAAHALFTQRGTIHLTPYGPKTESEQSSRVTLVGVTFAVGKGSLQTLDGHKARPPPETNQDSRKGNHATPQ